MAQKNAETLNQPDFDEHETQPDARKKERGGPRGSWSSSLPLSVRSHPDHRRSYQAGRKHDRDQHQKNQTLECRQIETRATEAIQALESAQRLAEAAGRSSQARSVFLAPAGAQQAAAIESGRSARVIHQLSQGPDHPVSICHPEGEYLKGFILTV